MNKSPTTEIILCTYNGSDFIIQQLDSIVNQTREIDKISIYDDQSTDSTIKIIHNYVNGLQKQKRDLFSIRVNDNNIGYAKNFCNAIAWATEDILFLCDQDDIWHPNKVETLTTLLCNNNADMAFSDGLIINDSGEVIKESTVLRYYGLKKSDINHFHKNALHHLIKQNYINGAAIAIKKNAAQGAMPLPTDMPHDYWLALWCASHNGIIATSSPLYSYRQHEQNTIGLGSTDLLHSIVNLWKHSDAPREREARIWLESTKRIKKHTLDSRANMFQHKLTWIMTVAPNEKNSHKRIYNIGLSLINRNYKKYSPRNSAIRDIFSLFKRLSTLKNRN